MFCRRFLLDLPHKNFEVSEFGGVSSSSYEMFYTYKTILSAGMKKVFELSGGSSSPTLSYRDFTVKHYDLSYMYLSISFTAGM